MTVVAIIFLIYAFSHPEGSWLNISVQTVRTIYVLYIAFDIGLFVASILLKKGLAKNKEVNSK
jgi:hypothetical protein